MDWYNSTGIFDNSTYNNFGTFYGGLGTDNITTGQYGKALSFDGTDDYIRISDSPSLNFETGDFSIEAWVKSTFTDWQTIISKINTDTLKGYYLDMSSDWIVFVVGAFDLSINTNPTLDGNWHQIVAIRNESGMYLYVDGVFLGNRTVTPENASVEWPLSIGVYNDASDNSYAEWFNGTIDEVRIYNRALSEEEINASYNNGLYRLYHNFTSLSNGKYDYYAYAIDTAGNANKTEVRTVTIASSYLTSYLTDCSVLDQAGTTYYLTADIINSNIGIGQKCMNIISSNIILDCQGHTIDGTDKLGTIGVYVYPDAPNNTNITIKNCILTDWGDAGIYFRDTNNSLIYNNSAFSNEDGIEIVGDLSNVIIYNNTLSNNDYYGLNTVWAAGTIITNNTISNNGEAGIYAYSLGGGDVGGYVANKIYNNLLNNTLNVEFGGTIYLNYWNTTRQSGTRIYSAGTEIGGNYWTNPNGNGYSDICRDVNGDGFCDNYYELSATGPNRDYLPYSKWYNNPTWGAPRWSDNKTSIPSIYDPNILSIFNITWNDTLGYSIDTVLFESNFSGTPTNYTMVLIDPYINATEKKGVYNFNLTLPAGTFYWKSYANASDGAWNVSDTWYFTINKATPSLTLTASPSWTNTYPTETTVSGSETNSGDADLTYNLYRNNVLVNNPETTTLGAGSYTYVYNTSGGQNYTSGSVSNTLIINKAPTSIRLFLNGTEGNVSYTQNQVANFTVVLNVPGKIVNLYSDYPGWVLQSGLTPLMNYTLLTTAGSKFNLTGYFEGDENYTSSSQTYFFDVFPVSIPNVSFVPKCSKDSDCGSSYCDYNSHTYKKPECKNAGTDKSYCDWVDDYGSYCLKCMHCGDGVINCDENVFNCPKDVPVPPYTNVIAGFLIVFLACVIVFLIVKG
jgi:parallel beta-helix repeat protein